VEKEKEKEKERRRRRRRKEQEVDGVVDTEDANEVSVRPSQSLLNSPARFCARLHTSAHGVPYIM